MFLFIYYYIYLLLYYIIYYYIFIFIYYYIYIYIIIIYIVMCPKNWTIFMLRVPKCDFLFFVLVYVYMDNGVFGWKCPWWGIWRGFYSELFLYFEEHWFYMGTGVVFWCMELWCYKECKWIVCGFCVGLGG